jgi:hypothetical protein
MVSVTGVLTVLPPLPIVTMVLAAQLTFSERISVSASLRPVAEANRNHGSKSGRSAPAGASASPA